MPLHPNSRLVLCHVPLAPREKGHEYPTEDPELNIMELLLWRNGTGIGGISAAPGSLAWHRGLKGLALPQLLGSLQLQLGSDPWRELHMLRSGQKRKKKKNKNLSLPQLHQVPALGMSVVPGSMCHSGCKH